MSGSYLQLRRVAFAGPNSQAEISFSSGVNVICGASETGKSFLAESIDFMLGGSQLREIPERTGFGQLMLDVATSTDELWRLSRSTSGGDSMLTDLLVQGEEQPRTLKQKHAENRTDNLSGFLLEKVGLLGKRVLKSSAAGTTRSLSFRDLARLVIVQENEIQQTGSPLLSGQFVSRTAELATVKLLLTGVDDSAVVSAADSQPFDSGKQIALIDELLADVETEIGQISDEKEELEDQLARLNSSIESQQSALSAAQGALDLQQNLRRDLFQKRTTQENRASEISELLARFDLLRQHYQIDLRRLSSIRESGSLLVHIAKTDCPVCGAHPDAQHSEESCDGNVEAVVVAATAEVVKIERLLAELETTVEDLRREGARVTEQIAKTSKDYEETESSIRHAFGPELGVARSAYSALIEERAKVDRTLDLFRRKEKLESKRAEILESEIEPVQRQGVIIGIPDSAAHELSLKIASILRAWHFPGDCVVHYDKSSADFVIDGKPRGSRGKGLRAITHASVNIGLLEYCQEKGLPHPGFAVLDSPLLAYYQPEGEDDQALQGTDLKDRFYDYLIEHHGNDSQIVIIENQHPPSSVTDRVSLTVFTRNPKMGRFGLL